MLKYALLLIALILSLTDARPSRSMPVAPPKKVTTTTTTRRVIRKKKHPKISVDPMPATPVMHHKVKHTVIKRKKHHIKARIIDDSHLGDLVKTHKVHVMKPKHKVHHVIHTPHHEKHTTVHVVKIPKKKSFWGKVKGFFSSDKKKAPKKVTTVVHTTHKKPVAPPKRVVTTTTTTHRKPVAPPKRVTTTTTTVRRRKVPKILLI
jgi:hypothetical protein